MYVKILFQKIREFEDRHFNLIWCFVSKPLILDWISFHKDFSGGKFPNKYLIHARVVSVQ